MKNTLFILGLMIILIVISNMVTNDIVIPDDSIRIRIIANSNNDIDQNIKNKIRKDVEDYLYKKITDSMTIEEADITIKENLSNINEIVKKYSTNFKINYGKNYFPAKEYKGIKYNSGLYDSLVITLDKGLGDNWWCILYPPLCMLDKANVNDAEYSTLSREIINKFENRG